MKIKLIYDAEVLGNAYKINETGIFRVAYELYKRFTESDQIELFYSYFNHNNHRETAGKIDRFFSDHAAEPVFVNVCERVKFIPFRKEKPFRFFYEKIGISNFKVRYFPGQAQRADIYHSLYYPIHKSLSNFPHLKKVVTVHDLIPILYPEFNENTHLLKQTIASIGAENHAICVSENTKKDLLHYAPFLDPEKVFVSLLAASPDKFYPCTDEDQLASARSKYNLKQKYFLSLSTLEPRKNIDHLIRCFIIMITKYQISDLDLVLVGARGWKFEKIFEEFDNAAELQNKIVFTGRIPDEELAAVYSGAHSFYYMSFYEGFGLPPLEAMQCGVPVVTSDTSSLPEVVGDAGFLLNPTDQNALVETMWDLYNDGNLRNAFAEKALNRAKLFSWEKTVEQHLQIYENILKN